MKANTFDKTLILRVAKQLAATDTKVERNHNEIVRKLIEQLRELGHPARVGMLEEATRDFQRDERKPGAARASEYQYVSRMKAIVGAVFLTKEKILEAGGVNPMYKLARKALAEAGLTWKGAHVMKQAEEDDKAERERLAAEATAKIIANAKENLSVGDLRAAVEQEVSTVLATRMLEKSEVEAEQFAVRMLKDKGVEYARRFADKLMAIVRS